MTRAFGSIVVAGVMMLGVTGCQSDKATASSEEQCYPAKGPNAMGTNAVNTNCPLTGEQADQSVVAAYNGKNIAFCCAGCVAKFQKMSDTEKAKVYATATTYKAK